ncbi:MAG: hypothetical protein IPL59_00595 [Candidatus Competibacteraceae bacterium]|nr:hypothetical protein [Candidatus Competibacteraceae bacterium]
MRATALTISPILATAFQFLHHLDRAGLLFGGSADGGDGVDDFAADGGGQRLRVSDFAAKPRTLSCCCRWLPQPGVEPRCDSCAAPAASSAPAAI